VGWSNQLASGEANLDDIQAAIRETNDYIEGAISFSRIIPEWSVFITLPLGIVTQLFPPLAPIGWGLLVVEGIGPYAKLVKKAVLSPNRLKFNWLMISRDQ
jgi:hypothetical protein